MLQWLEVCTPPCRPLRALVLTLQLISTPEFQHKMDLFYQYVGSVEASYLLLTAACLPRFSPVRSRLLAVLAEKAGVPNYQLQGDWGTVCTLTPDATHSHLYEGVLK